MFQKVPPTASQPSPARPTQEGPVQSPVLNSPSVRWLWYKLFLPQQPWFRRRWAVPGAGVQSCAHLGYIRPDLKQTMVCSQYVYTVPAAHRSTDRYRDDPWDGGRGAGAEAGPSPRSPLAAGPCSAWVLGWPQPSLPGVAGSGSCLGKFIQRVQGGGKSWAGSWRPRLSPGPDVATVEGLWGWEQLTAWRGKGWGLLGSWWDPCRGAWGAEATLGNQENLGVFPGLVGP